MKIWRKRVRDLINECMNDRDVFRTAPATPGLLIISKDENKLDFSFILMRLIS